jgi:transposase-like protein
VIEHLPEADRDPVKRRLVKAWKETDHDTALEQLHRLAIELEREHPGAAASLREGMAETLTVTRLGITGKLKLTLQSTNPCESMISTVRVIHRNVKNWSSGEMCMRWTAAGMLEAETNFRKVEGYELAKGEPKRLRYRLLHVAARLAFSGRLAKLHLQDTWPWVTELRAAFQRLEAHPAATG